MNNNSELENSVTNKTLTHKKRGRKSKKEIELALKNKLINDTNTNNNIKILIEDNDVLESSENINDYAKSIIETNTYLLNENINENINETKILKKRGRKPKGGKIIQQILQIDNNKETKPNVILHLKCFLKDLQTNPLLNTGFESFNFFNKTQLHYENIKEKTTFDQINNNNNIMNINEIQIKQDEYEYEDCEEETPNKDNDIREIWRKLKVLEHNLHINNICDKKSACFWCTCDFDNPPVYIPKHYIKESYHVYGCFCSPECATAYLMEENVDVSIRFERYHLMNHIYSKIYNYKKNIKPAPNPYYMLDKYYGNLTIQEYRSLLRNERLFLVVDKPLTRILPELHEENDDFIINNKIIPSNTYQIKKKIQKQNKSNILSERFGISQKQ